MKTRYDANSYHKDNSLTFIWGDPGARQRAFEAEMRMRYRSERDPERPPRWERGDKYIIIGTIVGLIVGGALGAIIGYHYLGLIGSVFCTVGGIFIGGILGATIGNLIKKRQQKIMDKKHADSLRYLG